MPRANGRIAPEAIRIEEEVWEEAFSRREPASENRRRRLRAIEGGRSDWLSGQSDTSAPVPAAPPIEPDGAELSPATWLASATASDGEELGISRPPLTGEADFAPTVRRTVKIQGRGAERHIPSPDPSRRRPARRAYERTGFRPDRLAMWAVLLGFLLVFVAIASGHG